MPERIKKITSHDSFNMWWLNIGSAISCLLAALMQPAFTKYVFGQISQRLISIQYFTCCVASIGICYAWNKSTRLRKMIMKHFEVLMIAGVVIGTTVDVVSLLTLDKSWNVYIIVICNQMMFDILICEWFNRSNSLIKASLFEESKKRNKFDTNSDFLTSISAAIGFLVGIFIELNMKVALVLSITSGLFWFLKYIVIYILNKETILSKM